MVGAQPMRAVTRIRSERRRIGSVFREFNNLVNLTRHVRFTRLLISINR
jgi:hypothetical protein